jgi:hypothetical protein
MRVDIVPGTVLSDYELSDHRGMRRSLSELQGAIRWCSCSRAAGSVRKTGGNMKGSCSSTARCK